MKNNSVRLLYLLCFSIAFAVRLFLIFSTPEKNNHIDLQIYRDAGQLMVNGINPYDFNDEIDLREKLRTDEICYNDWVCSTQEIWNYCSSANLPLATILFYLIEYIFSNPLHYRVIFAFLDSILSIFILVFILNRWNIYQDQLSKKFQLSLHAYKIILTITGLLLGALNPILLAWGILWPEPKGTGLLLMISALYYSESRSSKNRMVLSPILLGFSISFIGLGVFVAPICFYNIYVKNGIKNTIYYSVAAFIAFIIWIIPFLPEIITMMDVRLKESSSPYHGSMWVEFVRFLPDYWVFIKHIFTWFFIILNIVGLIRKRINIPLFFASLLFLFTCIYLTSGGLDRMNIALVTLILILGYSRFFNITIVLSILYLLYGIRSFVYTFYVGPLHQIHDGRFILIFTIIFTAFLSIQIIRKDSSVNHKFLRIKGILNK